MPRVMIDTHAIEVPPGTTLLEAARRLGIEIPTLCFLDGREPATSCMVCVVKLRNPDRLVPSCATVAQDGMHAESDTEEVRDARRAALELLLSDHLGDCVGPCQATCPAHMDIPLMIRQIAAGRLGEAIVTVKEQIALPAVLGRICPAPCEKACRRAIHDAPLAICLLKRYVADADLASTPPYLPSRKPDTGKRVAIAGAGPTGLAAAYYLLQEGHACTLFDEHDEPGGMLRYAVPEEELPRDVLDAEIAAIRRLGGTFQMGTRVGRNPSLDDLRKKFSAVLLAFGETQPADLGRLGVKASEQGIQIDRETCETSVRGVFAGGGAVRKLRLAVRAVADGKAAAASIGQLLAGQPVTGPHKVFSTHIGRLRDGEIEKFMEGASTGGQVAGHRSLGVPRPGERPGRGGLGAGFTEEEARQEASRCLHCDCRKPVACKLRQYADAYGADPNRYKGGAESWRAARRAFEHHLRHPDVIYEPGKCILCGLCVQITAAAREALGLTFIGRGFRVRVGVPFGESAAEGLRKVAAECVAACPTGALALKEGEPDRTDKISDRITG